MTMKQFTRWVLSFLLCLIASTPVNVRAQENSSGVVPFPVLPGLEKPVEFWKRIFAEYSLSQLVFFDPRDMGTIYEVIDIGEEQSRSRGFVDRERARIAAANGVDLERVRAQRGIKERTADGLQRSGRLIAQMQQIFREKGLPLELTYLPLVESSFNLNARSHVGALGMWQFMPATGKRFLRVTRHLDERRDPLESTRAAASLLEENYQILGNWPLAVTAYNYGAGGLARAVAEIQSDNLVEIIREYNHRNWGFAAKNFYAEFLAAVEIASNVGRYFPDLELHPAITIHEVELAKNTSIVTVSKTTGLTRQELFEWNPALSSRTSVLPAGYRVKVPEDRKMTPLVEVAAHQAEAQPQILRHRVKRGDTLMRIARRYGASVEKILQANDLRKSHLLQVGMTLLIPKL
jgi:membrane-bound lytic murein transglycosylase D